MMIKYKYHLNIIKNYKKKQIKYINFFFVWYKQIIFEQIFINFIIK